MKLLLFCAKLRADLHLHELVDIACKSTRKHLPSRRGCRRMTARVDSAFMDAVAGNMASLVKDFAGQPASDGYVALPALKAGQWLVVRYGSHRRR